MKYSLALVFDTYELANIDSFEEERIYQQGPNNKRQKQEKPQKTSVDVSKGKTSAKKRLRKTVAEKCEKKTWRKNLYPLVENSNQFLLFLRTMRATHLPEN